MRRLGAINIGSGITSALSAIRLSSQTIYTDTEKLKAQFDSLKSQINETFNNMSFNTVNEEMADRLNDLFTQLTETNDEIADALYTYVNAREDVGHEIDKLNQEEVESYRKKAKEITAQIEKIKNEVVHQQELIAKAEAGNVTRM